MRFLVEYARKHSSYLKEKYADLKQDFALADIPISARSEMVAHLEEWVCDPEIIREAMDEYFLISAIFTNLFLEKYSLISTSGAMAEPLRIIRDARHNAVNGVLMVSAIFMDNCLSGLWMSSAL